MRTHGMFDLETLGKQPNTVVLSVGAVVFNAEGVLGKRHWFLNLDEQLRTRKVDASTIVWWMGQSKEAQTVFKNAEVGISTRQFCKEFLEFYESFKADIVVWGNGASFDIPIIEHLLYSNQFPIPWKYWDIRCYRTVKKAHMIEKNRPRSGVKHDALDDAVYQAECLRAFFECAPEYDA